MATIRSSIEGGSTTYAYDTLNRLQTLAPPSAFTAGAAGNSFGFSYDALSRRTQMTRPNGVNTNYSYDNLSRLLSVLHQAGGATIDGASYTLDAVGNRTAKTDNRTNVTTSYGYDAIYQLTSATQNGTATESYSYDAVGNRLSALASAGWSYNASNELTSTPNGSYTYDANGNTLTDAAGRSYTWDFENRLAQVVVPGGPTVTFKYDPFGRRIQRVSASGIMNYLYDMGSIVAGLDGSGNVVAQYAQGTGIDEPLAMGQDNATGFYETDGLGSVTSLTNGVGTVTDKYSYGSFGTTASAGMSANSFRYTGREWDSDTGLYYYRDRYYDPAASRFISEDPAAFDSGVNFYKYAGNRPTLLVDPQGDSSLVYDPNTNTITLYADNNFGEGNGGFLGTPGGVVLAQAVAYNHPLDFSNYFPPGDWEVATPGWNFHTPPDPNGDVGIYGIVMFSVPGHVGLGVHAGRVNKVYKNPPHTPPEGWSGPSYVTHGCIRTNEQFMRVVYESTYWRLNPVRRIRVLSTPLSASGPPRG